MDLTQWIFAVSAVILAYMLGSIPFSLMVGKIFFRKDVRKEGSGNAGATNTFRVLGWKAGVPVFLLDVLKGWFAVYLINWFPEGAIAEKYFYYLTAFQAIAVVSGHIYPLFAGFKGGKGVATLLGVALAMYPISGLMAFGVFIIVFLLSGYVSLGSIIACTAFPFISYFLIENTDPALVIFSIAVGSFVPITHLENIGRLLSGTESRFLYKSRK